MDGETCIWPVDTADVPKPLGHYSQAIVANGFVYVSGQLPLDPADGKIPIGFESQVRTALDNLENILIAAGSRKNNIINVNVFLTSVDEWGKFNSIYAEFMGEHKPARAVSVSPQLHYGSLVEIQAVAVI